MSEAYEKPIQPLDRNSGSISTNGPRPAVSHQTSQRKRPGARTRRQIEQDRERLALISRLVPQDYLRKEVESYFRDLARMELGAALGDPVDIVKKLSRRLRTEYADDDEALAFAEFLEGEVSGRIDDELNEGVPQISPEFIDAEVRTVRTELIRTWVGLLDVAWRFRADETEMMDLDIATLYPRSNDFAQGKFEKWDQRRSRTELSLRNAVALSSDALVPLTKLFSKQVLEQLEKNLPIELPDGLEIAHTGTHVVLRDRAIEL